MFTPRLALLSLVSVLLSGLASAVTFSPEFEKTLDAGLKNLKQQVQEYPKLQTTIDGIPMDVASWAALSRDDIVTTLRFFSDQKANALQTILVTDPSSAPKVEKFTKDSFDFVMSFVDNIKSGAFTSAPAASTPAPTTKAPEATTATPTVTTAVPTEASTATPEATSAPTESANTDGSSSSGSAGETEEVKPATTKAPASTPSPVKTSSAASLVTTVAPAVVGTVTAAFFAMC